MNDKKNIFDLRRLAMPVTIIVTLLSLTTAITMYAANTSSAVEALVDVVSEVKAVQQADSMRIREVEIRSSRNEERIVGSQREIDARLGRIERSINEINEWMRHDH
jgi:hypothetical protein